VGCNSPSGAVTASEPALWAWPSRPVEGQGGSKASRLRELFCRPSPEVRWTKPVPLTVKVPAGRPPNKLTRHSGGYFLCYQFDVSRFERVFRLAPFTCSKGTSTENGRHPPRKTSSDALEEGPGKASSFRHPEGRFPRFSIKGADETVLGMDKGRGMSFCRVDITPTL